jgi:hypothetical protein
MVGLNIVYGSVEYILVSCLYELLLLSILALLPIIIVGRALTVYMDMYNYEIYVVVRG